MTSKQNHTPTWCWGLRLPMGAAFLLRSFLSQGSWIPSAFWKQISKRCLFPGWIQLEDDAHHFCKQKEQQVTFFGYKSGNPHWYWEQVTECSFRKDLTMLRDASSNLKPIKKTLKGRMLFKVQETLECCEQLMWWCLIFETQRVEHAVEFCCPDFQTSAWRSAAISLLETPAFLSFCPCSPWFFDFFLTLFQSEKIPVIWYQE